MSKQKIIYICENCGYHSAIEFGKCPQCGGWQTLKKQSLDEKIKEEDFSFSPQLINEISEIDKERISTGITALDNLLGGGIVEGSLILVAGPPGIGKSTLFLQIANNFKKEGPILYISGEENPAQIKIRAKRLGVKREDLIIFTQNNLKKIIEYIHQISPNLLIIDSIQTIYSEEFDAAMGSILQVKECAGQFQILAKTKQIPTIISGHITKTGVIAGPKVLEHLVDVVISFEERKDLYRIIRVEKNRFGRQEIEIFEMKENGLFPIKNPSELFLQSKVAGPGNAVVGIVEGSKPLLVEVQALLSKMSFSYPRRQVSGLDYNRIILLIAIIENRLKIPLNQYDLFVNVAGGLKISEPASDLGIILGIVSSFLKQEVPIDTIVSGEVGLAGEVRPISYVDLRIKEAVKNGFKRFILPAANLKESQTKEIELLGVANIGQALVASGLEKEGKC